MKRLTDDVVTFLKDQGYVIVATIDSMGRPHSACKGIVEISPTGTIYLLDLYSAATYKNLLRNPAISITAVNEHKFMGYCLKGKARIVAKDTMSAALEKAWEDRIAGRIAGRLLKNIREEKGHPWHPEARLPKPKYLIAMRVEEVIDLTPIQLRSRKG
jgi:uncharacterized pyridoxamine 5'-phosphate oxidase family protein